MAATVCTTPLDGTGVSRNPKRLERFVSFSKRIMKKKKTDYLQEMSAREEPRWQPGSGPGFESEDSVPAEPDNRVVDNKETHLAEEQNKRTEENNEQQNKVIEDLKQRLYEK